MNIVVVNNDPTPQDTTKLQDVLAKPLYVQYIVQIYNQNISYTQFEVFNRTFVKKRTLNVSTCQYHGHVLPSYA